MRDPFVNLVEALHAREVRFVVTGAWGANYYALSAGTIFETYDRDIFLPRDPQNALDAWQAAQDIGLALYVGDEPLDLPRDLDLADRVVQRQALVKGTNHAGLEVDFTLVMGTLDFETVWAERRTFLSDDVSVPVARLLHIVRSKETANRDKDRLFLATHEEALRQLLGREPS